MSKIGRRFCPKCKSDNVKLDMGKLPGDNGNWVCNKCGFHNVEFPIKEKIKTGKNKDKKPKIKNTKIARNIAIAVISVVVVAVVLMLIGNQIEARILKEKQETENYQGWLSDNCECLERERFYCSKSDFKVVGGLCVNKYGNISTTRILGCSLYSCLSQENQINITWNNKTWEPKLN